MSVLASLPAPGIGASTGSSVVGANVLASITLQDGCVAAPARSFGTVTTSSSNLTATGSGVCRFTFGSSNSSSMLRMYQADRTTQAMTARPTSWSWRSGGGATIRLAQATNSLVLAQDTWHSLGRYWRSTDGGVNWTEFQPGGGTTPWIAAASPTVAWRMGGGNVQLSTNMQAATPSWSVINPNVQGGGLVDPLDIDAVSSTVAWASGYAGVYRTGDAGSTNWSLSWPGSCINPSVIDATSASTAFVLGWGSVCRTTNSNASWTTETTGLPAGFAPGDIMGSPQTATTIWIAGANGRVARSTDNGSNWNLVTPLPIPVDVTTLQVVSDAEAFAGGLDGLVFRTTDSGATWTRFRAPFTGPITGLVSADGTNVVVGANGGPVHATPDGGATWSALVDARDEYQDLDAVDTSVLIASMSKSRVSVSTDDGATVTLRDVGWGNANVRGVAVIDTSTFIAVGDQGRIATTEDGGLTWTQRASGTAQDLWDVDVTGEATAVAVGASGTILRSADGGRTWTTRSAAGNDLRRIDIRSGAPAIAVGMGGAIRRSTDDGVTWTSPASGTAARLDSVAVASDLVIYAAATGTLLKSIDGGATWTASSIGGMGNVEALSPDVVWISSNYTGGWQEWVDVSTDGGASWVAAWGNQDPDVSRIHAIDPGRIYFAGSAGKLRVTDAPATIADYSAGGWSGGSSMFGACLQDLAGSATAAGWAEDASGTCTASDADSWYAIPTAPVKVAQMAAAGTGTVDVVWGMRVAASQSPGVVGAGIVVEAVAPNA